LITIDDEAIDPRVHRKKIYPGPKKINPLITISDEAIGPGVHREDISRAEEDKFTE
jgi:hypothetical protein